MSYVVRSNAALPKAKAWNINQPRISNEEKQRRKIPTRRAEISWLDADGNVASKTAVIPALPAFQNAFTALAQGSLIQTTEGPVAVEDLEPGMQVCTGCGRTEEIRWIGSMTFIPNSCDIDLPEAQLFRMTDGSYGHDRNAPDLMVGPGARILPGVLAVDNSSPLREIADLADGCSVLQIRPMSPVRVFHICLKSHALMRANGVLVESYHPGAQARQELSHEMFAIFMSLFPNVSNEGDFGPVNHKRAA